MSDYVLSYPQKKAIGIVVENVLAATSLPPEIVLYHL